VTGRDARRPDLAPGITTTRASGPGPFKQSAVEVRGVRPVLRLSLAQLGACHQVDGIPINISETTATPRTELNV
jgi:hypothetical protein